MTKSRQDISRQMKDDPDWLSKNRLAGMQFVDEADGACFWCGKHIPSREAQRRLVTAYKKFYSISVSRDLCARCVEKKFLDPTAKPCGSCITLPAKVKFKPTSQEVRSTYRMSCEDCDVNNPKMPDEFDGVVNEAKTAAKDVCKHGTKRDINEFCHKLNNQIDYLKPRVSKPSHRRVLEELGNIVGMAEQFISKSKTSVNEIGPFVSIPPGR